MKTSRLVRTVLILVVLMATIGCDQVSKSIVRHKMSYDEQIGFIHNHFTLTRIENSGAFLSLGDSLGNPFRFILLTLLPMIALGFGLVYVLTKTALPRLTLLGIILVLGGGIGNLYDRVVHGSVTDFMHINFVIFQTGIFNVADMAIMAGMFIILLNSYLKRLQPEAAGTEENL